jgi:uncharacterized membrane protein YgcG
MKLSGRLLLGAGVLIGSSCFVASAQSVISAKSGLIHYVEGRVLLGDQVVESKFGSFPEVREKSELRTEDGRAEVLLTPGVILRIGESSAIRMITNRLIDTRVEFLSGSILVEAGDLPKDNAVTIVHKDYTVQLQKKGLYRFDSQPDELRVYDGETIATLGDKNLEVREGRLLAFDGGMTVARFDTKDGDSLYRWSRRRGEYLALANISAAKSVRDSGYYMGSNSWYWNPYFNMYTFIPARGLYSSPWGFAFWSPYTVYDYLYYAPMMQRGGGRVYRGVAARSVVTAKASAPAQSVATATSTTGTAARSATGGVARSSSGGTVSRGGGFGGGSGFGGGAGAGGGAGRGTPRGR